MADKIVTKEQIKARLEVVDAGDDAMIDELIEELTDWLQEYTGRRFLPEAAATYVVDTSPGSVITIRRGIRAVTALAIASTNQPDTGGVYVAVAAAEILLRPAPIDRRPGWPATSILLAGSTGRLSQALNGATVTGDFGFLAPPPGIQGVAIDAVVTAYSSHRGGASDVIGADGTTIYPWAKYFSKGSPQRATVDRYRGGPTIS